MTGDHYHVAIDVAAEADLHDIVEYLVRQGANRAAQKTITSIFDRIAALDTMPLRGAVPKELEGAAGRGFRQFISDRYRVIYRVDDREVTVVMVADGRRDMRKLVTERLLGS